MSDNLGVTQDNMSSPPPPELIPPLHFFSSWLFEVNFSNDNYIVKIVICCAVGLNVLLSGIRITRKLLMMLLHFLHCYCDL